MRTARAGCHDSDTWARSRDPAPVSHGEETRARYSQQKLMQAWTGCWGGLGALAVVFTTVPLPVGRPWECVCGGGGESGGITLMPAHIHALPPVPCATPLPRAPARRCHPCIAGQWAAGSSTCPGVRTGCSAGTRSSGGALTSRPSPLLGPSSAAVACIASAALLVLLLRLLLLIIVVA